MKKIVMLIATVALSASVAFAQDVNSVIEIYNTGIMQLEAGEKKAALECFQTALAEAEILGEEGVTVADNCKISIPAVMLSIANDSIDAKDYDTALEYLAKAEEAATLYGDTVKAANAKSKASQVLMVKANEFLKAKDYAGAIGVYNEIMKGDSTNAMAALRLGQCYAATGDNDNAEAALNIAAANGQEKQANKQLSTIYVKKAAAALKENKTQDAFNFAVKSNEFLENANALKIAGQCAMKLGKTADALPFLEKYVEVSPNAKDANQMRFNIAAAAQKLGQKEKAKSYYQQVLTDPKLGTAAKQQLDALNK